MRVLALVALFLGACHFTPGELTPDGVQPSNVTVAFMSDSTLTDEMSGTVQVHVVLSEAATTNVSVAYTFAGNTASKGSDFNGADGTLTFAPGETDKTLDVTIVMDTDSTESSETFDINLSSPVNAKLGTPTKNTVTISATPLPRVSFMTTSATGAEDVSSTVTVLLDAASTDQVTVDLTPSGSAADGGADYSLSTNTVTFAAGETTKTFMINVVDDTTDEDNEDAILTLSSPTKALLATSNTVFTRTITDNDAPPSVTFTAATSSVAENVAAGTATINVSLSAASGKTITVAFADAGTGTATPGGANDYTIATTSPLTFSPGMTSMDITVNIKDDAVIEGKETVVLALGTLTNASAGANQMHTLTITDDDGDCEGNGNYKACFAAGNITAGTVSLTGTLDTTPTTGDARCKTPDTGGTATPSTCYIAADTITISGALTVTGTRALALYAVNAINVSNNIDASSKRGGSTGPGSPFSGCGNFPVTMTKSDGSDGASGGAGGSFRSAGGSGGAGGLSGANGGTPIAASGAPTVLRAGCPGQTGGADTANNNAGARGNGGGAIYLVAGGTLTITSGKFINVSGAGGTSPGHYAGGGGGGSGGMIRLDAATFSVNGAILMANGGGASGGADSGTNGGQGSDPQMTTPIAVANGGMNGSAGGNGGNGFAVLTGPTITQATNGGPGTGGSSEAGGGGGGGGGHIEATGTLSGAIVSAGP